MRASRYCKFGFRYLRGYKPEGVGLILTRRCNIDCSYCKIKDNSRRHEELKPDEWKQIISKFIENKHMHFIFTGGEPLLYEGVFDLIDFASREAATSMITNTLLLNRDTFSRLKGLDYLTFSCDTKTKDNSLKKDTMERFKMISEESRKYDIKPSVIITITSKNTNEIVPLIREASRYDISVLLSLIHSDEGDFDFRGHAPYLEFKTEDELHELKDLQENLIKMKREGYKIAESDHFILNMVSYASGRYQISCPATDPFFTIDCDGLIKPCHDIKSSDVNAKDFSDYHEMKRKVAESLPKECNCYYDCYINRSSDGNGIIRRVMKR